MTFGDLPLLLAGLLIVMAWLAHGHPSGAVPAWLLVSFSLLFAAGLLAVLSADNENALLPTLRFSITLVVMPLTIMFAASRGRRIQALVNVWLLAAVTNSVVAMLDLLRLTSIGPQIVSVDFLHSDRAAGLTLHPNHLGLVAAMAIPVALAKLTAGGMQPATGILALPLLVGGVAASGSRGAFLASVGAALLFFLFQLRAPQSRARLWLAAALVGAIIVLVVTPSVSDQLGSVTAERLEGGGGSGASDSARLSMYRAAIDQGVNNPIVGEGFDVVLVAHNIYLQLMQGGGLFALAGFLIFATGIMCRARRAARPDPRQAVVPYTLLAASSAAMGTWLLYGLAGNALYDRYLYAPAGFVLAIGFLWRSSSDTPR